MNKLRFAPLIRVSTEQQKKKGESLKTQLTQIIQYVDLLKGIIPENCLIYQGQEHATAGQERLLFDKLLDDSSKGLFDAVIVTDASRWSRDNLKSEIGLNLLAENGIKFFVGTMEYNLYDAEHRFILTMSTSINQLQATKQSQNSIINRIERAKKGWNSAGLLPYGRTFVKGVWGIDLVKKAIIEDAAKRYIAGEHIPDIAATLGMNASNLHRILTKHSGTKRTTTFKYKRISETVDMIIPALLDEKTIKAVQNKIYNNTTTRGNRKNYYLLQGYIYCAECGYKMKSHTSESKKQYYLHSKYGGCKYGKFLPAPEIENALLIELIKTFGDPELIEKSIKKASPDMTKVDALRVEKNNIDAALKSITAQKNILIKKIAKELITDEEADKELKNLREQEGSFKQRLLTIDIELLSTPDPKHVKALSRWAGKIVSSMTKDDPKLIFKRSFEWKRKLIERAFNGLDATGHKLGIYITFKNGIFTYEIKGLLESTVNTLPLTDHYLVEAFHLDPELEDITLELKQIHDSLLSNIPSQYPVHSA
jgi:DNA invertase Pin-like site-specific DNA recombinase